jgi:hypothetical protein
VGDDAANSPPPCSTARLEAARLRLATLACAESAAAHSTAEARWRWPSWPGLGYHRPGGALTDRQRRSVVHWIRSRALAPEQGERAITDPPVLTVVVPLHNLGRYLPQAIESLFAQTRNDFDIIVIDDGSTDELTRIFVEQYRPARTSVVSQANQGVAAARNHGIRRARGRYICCLDPDDMLRRTYFEEAIARLDNDPQVGFVTGSLHMFDAREVVLTTEPFGIADMLATNKVVQPAVFRRTAWEECGGYYGGFSVQGVEDWDLWLSMLERGFRASVIPDVVWEYRILPNSMSSKMYRAEFWAPLRVELAARHQETFRNHVLTLVEQSSFELAGIKSYVADQQQAIRWWKQQADTWHSRFEQIEALAGELRAWNARLEEARDWSDTQAANWQRIAAEHGKAYADLQAAHESRMREMERTIEELRGWNGRVEEARDWSAAQAENWERLSAERDRLIAEQQAWIGELERAKTWHDTRRLRWKRLAQQRRRQLRLSKTELGS